MSDGERGLPSSISAEKSVLGAALIDTSIPAWLELATDDFHDPKNAFVWEAMIDLAAENRPIDEVTIEAQLSIRGRLDAVGGVAYLGELVLATPTADNVEYYATLVRDTSRMRRYALALDRAKNRILAQGCTPEDAERILDECTGEVATHRTGQKVKAISLAEAARQEMREIWDHWQRRQAGEEVWVGLQTGIESLDRLTGGLPRKIPTLLGGRPKQGKSTTALAIARQVALNLPEEVVLYVSYEDEPPMTARRTLSWGSDVNYARVRTRALDGDEIRALRAAENRIYQDLKNIMLIPAKGMGLHEVRRLCLAMAATRKISLVVLDYIQNTPSPYQGMRRHEAIEENFRIFETIISDLNAAGMMVSQLKRNEGKAPELEDFKDSGSLEQKGKLILAVYLTDDMRELRKGELHVLADAEGASNLVLELFYDLSRQTVKSWGFS